MDRTLLTSKHGVSKKTKECLKKLKERKTPFILVSARMPKSINKIRKEIEIDSPMICYSGGLIVNNNKYILILR
ncbi:HAD-IIB family hydrolase [uncultured Clostridium sp.]|uniref:HAD family hydrolase n=1 Tax=uncultured Clostridium sp. TaxID=59620 RepID=UPI00344B56AB